MNRLTSLRGLLFASAVLATSAASVAGANANSCDPMYPCFADQGTPAAVYDLTARAGGTSCDSYPCYVGDAKAVSPIAADVKAGEQKADQRI